MSKKVAKGGLTKHFGGKAQGIQVDQAQFAVPTFTYQEDTIEMLLTKVWVEGTEDQIKILTSLTYPSGEKILTSSRKSDIVIEIIGMLKTMPFEDVVDFLKEATGPNYVLWEQESMDPSITKLQREIALHEHQEVGIVGIGRCRFCSSNELVFDSKQLRSGDEPATIFVRCVSCGKNWRE